MSTFRLHYANKSKKERIIVANIAKPKNLSSGCRLKGGYGAFSVSRWDVEKIMGYVRKQKTHHSQNDLWPDYEESIEEVVTPDVPLLPAAWQAVSDGWVAEVARAEGD